MKLSTKGRYAVMAMADLASRMPDAASGKSPEDGAASPVSLAEIAERQEISQAYLEQLFAKLRRGGLVNATRGPGGGYALARPIGDIRISEIVQAVDEPMRVTRCELGSPKGCIRSGRCLTHDLWEELGRHIHLFLASITLADVVENRLLGVAGNIRTDVAADAADERVPISALR